MRHRFSLKYYSSRTILIILLIVFGFISSRALISIGTGLLAANLIFSSKEHQWDFFQRKNFPILAALLFFIVSLAFVAFTPDFQTGVKQLYHRLPWLIIPLSLAAIDKMETVWVHLVMSFLIFVIAISGVIVLINYFSNYEYYSVQIARAKNIPTPLNHIRYSLMVAFAGLASIYYAVRNPTKLSPYDQKVFIGTAIFLFVLIHILSVRSGLLCYYLGFIYLVLYFASTYKKWWVLPVFGIGILLMPLIAYHTLPSFKNKVFYMKYDIEQFSQGKIGHNSDGRRWRSLLMASDLIQNKPLFGYGLGAVENTSVQHYKENYPNVEDYNQKVPHMQFVFTMVEMGGIGLLFLIAAILIPVILIGFRVKPLYIVLWLIMISSCLVENTFESQLGMSQYLILGSLLLKQKNDE